jgi:hypothetical protein
MKFVKIKSSVKPRYSIILTIQILSSFLKFCEMSHQSVMCWYIFILSGFWIRQRGRLSGFGWHCQARWYKKGYLSSSTGTSSLSWKGYRPSGYQATEFTDLAINSQHKNFWLGPCRVLPTWNLVQCQGRFETFQRAWTFAQQSKLRL